jgi:hypothetical protein
MKATNTSNKINITVERHMAFTFNKGNYIPSNLAFELEVYVGGCYVNTISHQFNKAENVTQMIILNMVQTYALRFMDFHQCSINKIIIREGFNDAADEFAVAIIR